MLIRSRSLVLVAVALIGVGVAARRAAPPPGAGGRTPPPAALRPSPIPAPPPLALNIRGASLVVRRAGQKQAEVQAERVEVSRDLRFARFAGVARVTIYDHGRVVVRGAADEILLDRRTDDLRARGRVELTSPAGYRLTTAEVSWIAAEQRLVFPAGIAVQSRDSVIRAGRLVIDLGRQEFLLEGDVAVTFRLP